MEICRIKPSEHAMLLAFRKEVYKPFSDGKYASMRLSHWDDMCLGYLIAKGLKPQRAWKVALQARIYGLPKEPKPEKS